MPTIFWIGLGLAAFIFVFGTITGGRSRNTGYATGAALGAFLGFVLALPLLAIGLAGS